MRTLVALAASVFLSTGALACEVDAAAQTAPDPSIAAKKDSATPVVATKATTKAPTQASTKPKKDGTLAASVTPKPVYFNQRAGN